MYASWTCTILSFQKYEFVHFFDSHPSLWTFCYMDGVLWLRCPNVPRHFAGITDFGMMSHLSFSFLCIFFFLHKNYVHNVQGRPICLTCNTIFLLWVIYVLQHMHIMSCSSTLHLTFQSRGFSSWAHNWPSTVRCVLLTKHHRISELQRH